MKKLIGLCLVFALCLGFAGCGGRAAPTEEPAFEDTEMPDPSEMMKEGGDPGAPAEGGDTEAAP